MDQQQTLSTITILGFATSFIAAVLSQLWRSSVEIEGRRTKRLTPVGWLLIAIAMVGLSGSVASELLRVSIKSDEKLQAKADADHKQALLEQEERWRSEMSFLLTAAKQGIERNLQDTISGFRDAQIRSQQHTNEIVLAGQPLTSLSLRCRFTLHDSSLRKTMIEGRRAIRENAEESQGGVTPIPIEMMQYDATLLPLLEYVARIGDRTAEDNNGSEKREGSQWNSIVVLVPLDESSNAILSFGRIDDDVSWATRVPAGKDGKAAAISSGFGPHDSNSRRGHSIPNLRAIRHPNYDMEWIMDPPTLANAVDRTNPAIPSMGKFPKVLRIAILYDIHLLPFRKNDFGSSIAVNLWGRNKWAREHVAIGGLITSALTIEINGFHEQPYNYVLRNMYRLRLMDEDDEFDLRCKILEFEVI